MNTKYFIIAAATFLSFAACSSDEQQLDVVSAQQYEIRLANNLTQLTADVTRASGSYTNGFLTGAEFYAWVDMIDEGESNPLFQTKEFVKAWHLTVNATDNSVFDTETTQHFPVYNKVSFYAFHGNFSETITPDATTFPGLLTHRVQTAQTGDDDYLSSDLVYAAETEVQPQAAAITLPFQHMLSKIEVALMAGNQMSDAQIKEVTSTKVTVSIIGTKTQVEFRPSKSADPTTLAGRNAMLTVVDNSVQTITLSTVTTADFSAATCAAAIVVPQTVDGQFIKLSYMGHDTYYSVDNLELLSGYRYRFNFVVDRIGETFVVTPSLTVTPWGAEEVVNADLNTLISTSSL